MKHYNVYLPSYTIGEDAYDEIPNICSSYGKKIIAIGGKTAIKKSKDEILKSIQGTDLTILDFIWYGGDSSYENVEKLKNNPIIYEADMIFAIGGGRSLDTSKTLADIINKPIFTFPTIASNCAACTSVCVIYGEDKVFKELYFPKKPANHTFINTKIIANSPEIFLWAGIGDAISKEFESELSSRNDELEHFNAVGIQIGKVCTEPLVKFGEKALNDCKNNTPSYELEQVILDIIISTGLVSNLVINDYNSCLGHSIYYGMTTLKQIEENHLHGEVVAYGTLVLLTCDKQYEKLDTLYKLYKAIKLPTKLADLEVSTDDLKKVITKALETGDINHVPYEITYDMIYNSIMELEEYNKKMDN